MEHVCSGLSQTLYLVNALKYIEVTFVGQVAKLLEATAIGVFFCLCDKLYKFAVKSRDFRNDFVPSYNLQRLLFFVIGILTHLRDPRIVALILD